MPSLQDPRTRPTCGTGTLLVLVNALAIAPTAAHAQRTPAPTRLEVTGTSAAATVTWQPVKGALTYSVKRWKQDDLKCCNNSVADLTTTAWIDSGPTLEGFPQPGIYVFEVTAQLRRTSGAAVINWTLPAAETPASTSAVLAPVGPALVPVTVAPATPSPPAAQPIAGQPVLERPLARQPAPVAAAPPTGGVAVLPPVTISVNEVIKVLDAERALPSVSISVQETIGVADAANATPK